MEASMLKIDRTQPVLVTGATGYLAGWIVKRLLQEGLTVHATVRDPSDKEKLKYLDALAENSNGKLRYFKADLLNENSYADAMSGCATVFHTASPFKMHIEDPQKDLVDPALLGTRNILETANRTPSVKRIVLTSSCAAIYCDNIELKTIPSGVFDESKWNTEASLGHNPYAYSKTVAEQEAWKIAQQQKRWDLVVINPIFILGPGIGPSTTSESFNLIRQMGSGVMKAGIPDIGVGVVDVRDVAEAHLRAAFLPNAQGRNIISGHNTSLLGIARALLPKYQTYPLPRKTLPKWLVWLVGPIADKTVTRKFVSRNVGYPWKANNSKGVRELSMAYRPLAETIEEMFQQMIDFGQLPRITPKSFE